MITVAKLQRYGERGLIWITAKITFIAVMNQTHGNDITTIPPCRFLISDGGMPITCLKARLKLAGELNPVS